MNLYKLENPVSLKFNHIKRLVFILCFLFAKPTSKSYKLFYKTFSNKYFTSDWYSTLCLRKPAKINKFAKKRLFYPLTLVRGHLKQYLIQHFKLGKVKKFQNFIYKDEVITNVFAMAGLQKPIEENRVKSCIIITVQFELFPTVLKKPSRRLRLVAFVSSPWFPRLSFRR